MRIEIHGDPKVLDGFMGFRRFRQTPGKLGVSLSGAWIGRQCEPKTGCRSTDIALPV
jgi:hypothetical protein